MVTCQMYYIIFTILMYNKLIKIRTLILLGNIYFVYLFYIVYIGVVAKASEKSAAFAIVYACFALGGAISFFVSGYIEVNVNLWIHLSLLVVSVVVYIIGENVFSPSKCCANLCGESDDIEDVNDVAQDANAFTIIVNFDDGLSDSVNPTGQILTCGNKDLWDDKMIVNKVCADASAMVH